MATVWLKLDTEETAFGIYNFTGNIDQLKKAIKRELSPKLDMVSITDFSIYPPPSLSTPNIVLTDTGAFRVNASVSTLPQSEDSPWIVKIEAKEIRSTLGLKKRTNEGVPHSFGTTREATVKSIFELMFPGADKGDYYPLLFFKAPPLSGKTGMIDLLLPFLQKKQVHTLAFTGLDLNDNESVISCFQRVMPGFSFENFVRQNNRPRVLIIDEAQCTYRDAAFWDQFIKVVLQPRGFPGLRIVLFSSYGSFDPLRAKSRDGTPIRIPLVNIFGLDNSEEKPGLYLTGEEFKEMIRGSIAEMVDGLVWNLCGRHIGIAFHVVDYINQHFKNKRRENINQADVESVVRSSRLLDYILAYCRGMPSLKGLNTVLRTYEVEDFVGQRMLDILEKVSSGQVVSSVDNDRSPGSNAAVDLLTRVGFLYEDRQQILHFASFMHLKVWLRSSRKDPLIHLMDNAGLEQFVTASMQRLSASRLSGIARENDDIIRERQLQMEFYHSLVSCIPKSFLITPEWRTEEKDGYVDLVIRGRDLCWFLELLVDGDDAQGHHMRFQPNQKYHSSLLTNSRYVLIDFRQQRGSIRKFRDHFIYVAFDSDYRTASLTNENKETVRVNLSE